MPAGVSTLGQPMPNRKLAIHLALQVAPVACAPYPALARETSTVVCGVANLVRLPIWACARTAPWSSAACMLPCTQWVHLSDCVN
jgi:hypothetical protein